MTTLGRQLVHQGLLETASGSSPTQRRPPVALASALALVGVDRTAADVPRAPSAPDLRAAYGGGKGSGNGDTGGGDGGALSPRTIHALLLKLAGAAPGDRIAGGADGANVVVVD